MKKSWHLIGLLVLSYFLMAKANANPVSPNTVSFTQNTYNVGAGDTLIVDMFGSHFETGPDGAGFSMIWDPTVLNYVGTTIANPPWDTSDLNTDSVALGLIDFVFLNKTVGNAGTDFQLASFTFDVIGEVGDFTSLQIRNDVFGIGFLDGLNFINTNYVNSQVQVVPVPSAVWFFCSAIAGMFGMSRRKYVK